MIRRILSSIGRNSRRLKPEIEKSRARRCLARGEAHLEKSEVEEALACCQKALSKFENLNEAYHLMAAALMPGDHYRTLLSRFHDWLKPDGYVEIGVAEGETLSLANQNTKVVGIDPFPRIIKKITSRVKIYPIPSDEFFANYELLKELDTRTIPLAFIDGLHLFEQVLKDFINLERYAHKETVILIHDCLPVARILATRQPATDLWCGDVWKIVPCLKKYRPDLSVAVIPSAPSGLGMITNLDPTSTVLRDNLAQITAEYQDEDLTYEHLDTGEHSLMKMVPGVAPNDWPKIQGMLSSRESILSGSSVS
jgi:hypothetical protein